MSAEGIAKQQAQVRRERWKLLRQIIAFSERPLIALSLAWLALTIVDFAVGLDPVLQAITYVIWALFVLDFVVEFVVAPHKRAYLRGHWLTAVSLLLPALRVFRLVRLVRLLQATRVARSLSMVRLLTSLNRGMGALRLTLGRHGIGFVLGLTVAVVFAGAAGMRYFESPSGGAGPGVTGLPSYGDAVWWTAMTLTTLGAAYTPQTVAGRVLAFLLALYGLGVFGYLTATFAGFFIGQDVREAAPPDPAAGLRREVAALRRQVAALTAAIERDLPARDG